MTGQFEYVHNVRVPGMLHGRVVRPPAVGATLVSVDESSVTGMPGVVKVVVKKNFVGVVAEKPWQAIQAAGKLKVDLDAGAWLARASATSTTTCAIRQPTRDTFLVNSKDVDEKLAGAAKVVKATYCIRTRCTDRSAARARSPTCRADKATIWSATQAVYPLAEQRSDAARSVRRRTCT